MSSSRILLALLPATVLGVMGCRSDLLREQSVASPESRLAARVEVLEGYDCPGMASVETSPEQCLWPATASRSMLLAAVVEVVVHVTPEGRADGARLVNAPTGYDFEDAATQCAMRIQFHPHFDESGMAVAGDTCALRLRFARYVSDVGANQPAPLPCPPVRTLRESTPVAGCD